MVEVLALKCHGDKRENGGGEVTEGRLIISRFSIRTCAAEVVEHDGI